MILIDPKFYRSLLAAPAPASQGVDDRMENEFSLTVCICTRNRPDDLRRCLESLRTTSPLPHQVIVSDDSEDPQTAQELVSQFPFVEYQRGPKLGLGANRNACLSNARSLYVSFIDDDVTVPATYVADAIRAIEKQANCAPSTIVTGVEFKHTNGLSERVEPSNADFWGYQKVRPNGIYRSIVINAAIFPATLFKRAFFDPQLRYGSDEIDIARHAVSLGYMIVLVPELHVDHWPSTVNRGEYVSFIDASRMYATAKSYWQYQKKPIKAVAFGLLAPPKLAISLMRRNGYAGLVQSWAATVTAYRYAARAISNG